MEKIAEELWGIFFKLTLKYFLRNKISYSILNSSI